MIGYTKWGWIGALAISAHAWAAPVGLSPLEVFKYHEAHGSKWQSHKYLVTAKNGRAVEMETQIMETPCWVERAMKGGEIQVVECPSTLPDSHWIQRLSELSTVHWTDANYYGRFNAVPNDLEARQWHIQNTGQKIRNKWGVEGADISALTVWERQLGSKEIIVAIPDTGVWLEHGELQTNIWTHPSEICMNGIDDDGNGYIDDCNGWDFGDEDFDVSPLNIDSVDGCPKGHGTFIAGLIGADTHTGDGIAGLNWNVQMMPLKIAADEGCTLTAASISEAILYAVDNGAHIISTSFSFYEYAASIHLAFLHAQDAGVIVTIAAGNEDLSTVDQENYPIDFRHTGTLTVGASTNQDTIASFSNFGLEVDLFAPGHDVLSLGLNNTSHTYLSSGTSYASPLAAGSVALLLSEYPSLSPRQVLHSMLIGADLNSEWDCLTNERCAKIPGRLNVDSTFLQADEMMGGPYLALGTLKFQDQVGEAPGDLDGVLERGEVAYLYVGVDNIGTTSTGPVAANITIEHPHLVMSNHTVEYAPVNGKASVYPWFPIKVSLSKDCVENSHAYISIQFEDLDTGDTWSDSRWTVLACEVDDDEDGHLYPDDCNDDDFNINPNVVERCNGYDDNCDGDIDGFGSDGSIILYEDADGDGFGTPLTSLAGCEGTPGWSTSDRDCDDTHGQIYPAADELCDGLDNDCDVLVDENVIDPNRWYLDQDGDGLGDPSIVTLACKQPDDYVDNNNDCDDESTDSCDENPGTCETLGVLTFSGWAFLLLPGLWARRMRRP